MIKQDIRIYVAYRRPNGWTDWAGFFLLTLMGGGGHRLKQFEFFFIFFPRLTPGPSASFL